MSSNTSYLLVAVLLVGTLVSPETHAEGFLGTYEADGVTVELSQKRSRVTGRAILGDVSFAVVATRRREQLKGTMTVGGERLPFTGRLVGDELHLKAGGDTLVLRRKGARSSAKRAGADRLVEPGPAVAAPPVSGRAAKGRIYKSPDGWRARLPRKWKAAERGAGLVLGSDTEAGLIMVAFDGQRRAARVVLGELERTLAAQGVHVRFSKVTKRRSPFHVEAIGSSGQGSTWVRVVGKSGVSGTAIVVGITSNERSKLSNLRRRVDSVAKTISFFKPKASPRALIGTWYYYQDTSGLNSSGGAEATLALCPGGRYSYRSSYSFAANAGSSAAGAGAANDQSESGRWRATGSGSGNLSMTSNQGSSSTQPYRLRGQTLVVGNRTYQRQSAGCR